jgi:beta-N-acetylhexosaminidase
MGPLWLDIEGYELNAEDREILGHPTVGGVILFARNYAEPRQLQALSRSIRQAARTPILIGVDQEGGRVQRFVDGLTRLPAASAYAGHPDDERLAELGGWLMACELIACGIDLSFAPVLDIGFQSRAIGDRAFGEDSETVIRLSRNFLQGMKSAGMATTGKHFPGHGGVVADSHHEAPYDRRENVIETDMRVFRTHIAQQLLDAVMPAHVTYTHYDPQPASGSSFWLKDVLRRQLGFQGIVFSDDLSMAGASVMGDIVSGARQALTAGCDMILVCNQRSLAIQVLDQLAVTDVPAARALLKKENFSLETLRSHPKWKAAHQAMAALGAAGN